VNKNKIGYFIIASAIVWGVVIIGCALVLKGTPYKSQVTNILVGGSSFHLLFIWVPLIALFRKKSKSETTDKV